MNQTEKKLVKRLIGLLLIILTIPVILFIFQFGSYKVSDDVKDWSNAATYFGGFLGILISFFSLIILGYITYLINKQSNLENKKTNLLMRKLDAYNELTGYLPKLLYFLPAASRKIASSNHHLEKSNDIDNTKYQEEVKELIKHLEFFLHFHLYLVCFQPRYQHLFDYNFKNKDYKELEKLSNELEKYFKELIGKYELAEFDFSGLEGMDRYILLLNKFIQELQKEVK